MKQHRQHRMAQALPVRVLLLPPRTALQPTHAAAEPAGAVLLLLLRPSQQVQLQQAPAHQRGLSW